jgi:two-component system, cell cycle response regulator DivK
MIRVLLAEDHDDNREMLVRRLTRAGFEVRAVTDGQQALDAALAWRPDVTLMDVSMPVMSGLDATRSIRSQGGADLKIIALTAHAMAESREACLEAGCDSFATKPVDLPALVQEIQSITGKSLEKAA